MSRTRRKTACDNHSTEFTDGYAFMILRLKTLYGLVREWEIKEDEDEELYTNKISANIRNNRRMSRY